MLILVVMTITVGVDSSVWYSLGFFLLTFYHIDIIADTRISALREKTLQFLFFAAYTSGKRQIEGQGNSWGTRKWGQCGLCGYQHADMVSSVAL